jgi:hypothetical protein
LDALNQLNRAWISDGSAHAAFLQRPWSERQIVDQIAKAKEAKGRTPEQRRCWAQSVFSRGVENAGADYLRRLNAQSLTRLKALRTKGIIDPRTRKAFTKSQEEVNREVLRRLPDLSRRTTLFSRDLLADARMAIGKARKTGDLPEPVRLVLFGLMSSGLIHSRFYNWATSPASKPPFRNVFQPDLLNGTDRYVLPKPLTAEWQSAPRLSEVYDLEFAVWRLKDQLENLAPSEVPQWRVAQARSAEATLHELEERLRLLKDELRGALFKETGIANHPLTFDDWKKRRLAIPAGSVVRVRMSFPPLSDEDRKRLERRLRTSHKGNRPDGRGGGNLRNLTASE